jgi:sec-independent protein translocase protein TatC
MLLNRAGILTRTQIVASRRYAIVGIFIAAAFLTPPDVVSQLMLAIPLLILFEGTLLLMLFTERRDAREKAAEERAAETSEAV